MSKIQLFVELNSPAETASKQWLDGADGLVVDPAITKPRDTEPFSPRVQVLKVNRPEALGVWRECEGVLWASEVGLEKTARLRDAWPGRHWIPRLLVHKPALRYDFSNQSYGEGFKVYVPDTGAIHGGYRVTDGNARLDHALVKAAEMGFETVWLHARDAEGKGGGMDLDLLERAQSRFSGQLWFSGGASEKRHFTTLAAEGGATAVVVRSTLAWRLGCQQIVSALTAAPVDTVAVSFDARTTCRGPGCLAGT